MTKRIGRKATRLVDGRPPLQVTDQTWSVHASPASEDGPKSRCGTERQDKQRATQQKDNPNPKHERSRIHHTQQSAPCAQVVEELSHSLQVDWIRRTLTTDR